MIYRRITSLRRLYYEVFYDFRENQPREIKAAPDSGVFSVAI